MAIRVPGRSSFLSDTALLFYLAGLKFLLHALNSSKYGYFRDEFYFLACSEHLDFGYVDQPPLAPLVLAASRFLLGDSLPALRLLPALAGAGLVFLTGLIVRELGGRRFAQLLAATAVIVAPVYLAIHHFYSMNAFDLLFWALASYVTARLLNTGDRRLWLVLGLILGLGLQNKISVLFFGFGLAVGLLLTPQRRQLREKWSWLAGLIAALIFLPHILWQIRHDWPTLEFIRNAQQYKNVPTTPLQFLLGQILQMHPFTLPIWLSGLGFFLLSRAGQPWRLFGWMYPAIFVLFTAQNAKAYYLAPIYPVMLAGGAVLIEAWIQASHSCRDSRHRKRTKMGGLRGIAGRVAASFAAYRDPAQVWSPPLTGLDTTGHKAASHSTSVSGYFQARRWNFVKPAILILLITGGALSAPLALPVLPVETLIQYSEFLGVTPPAEERHELGKLPQHFADMFGWENLVETVAQVYNALPADERAKCAIFGDNYGEAGAVDLLGRKYGLPKAISGHNSYWLWGPRDYTGDVVIVLGADLEDMQEAFETVEKAAVITHPYCMPYENNLPVWIGRRPKIPLKLLWPSLKGFS